MHREFLSIYLAGNIQKGHETESQLFWTEEHQREMERALAPLSLSFLNPAVRSDDLSDQLSVFGRDMTLVFCSDLIIVDARERRGLGVGAEMMWAKWHTIPVIALAPPNSHYRKDKGTLLGEEVEDWVHPFVECLSDVIVADLSEAIQWIQRFLQGDAEPIKGPAYLEEAMDHYRKTQLGRDRPMQALIAKNRALQELITKGN